MVDDSFEDVATKFYEHYVLIAESINEARLWDEEEGFFYDLLTMPNGENFPLKVHSTVGLSVLLAVSIIDYKKIEKLTDFKISTAPARLSSVSPTSVRLTTG